MADGSRVRFLANYTSELRRAIYEDGVDVRGYYAWCPRASRGVEGAAGAGSRTPVPRPVL